MKKQLTIVQRLQAPTSKFFRPILLAGAVIAALAAGLAAAQEQLNAAGIPFPNSLVQISEIVAWVAGAVSALSGLTVDFEALKPKAEDGLDP